MRIATRLQEGGGFLFSTPLIWGETVAGGHLLAIKTLKIT